MVLGGLDGGSVLLDSLLALVRIDIAAWKSEAIELVEEQLDDVDPTDWTVTVTAMSSSKSS